MKRFILSSAIFTMTLFNNAFCQDINTIFNNNLTFDATLSKHTKAISALMASYGKVQTKIYRYNGTFEEAIKNMKIPNDADVSEVNNQSAGISFGTYILMTKELDLKPMADEWYQKAELKSDEYSDKMTKSMSITINPPEESKAQKIKAGDIIEMRKISLSSPFVDLDNLTTIEGTWISEIIVSTTITDEMLENTDDDFEEAKNEREMNINLKIPEDAIFVSVDDVADSELLAGDFIYLIEISPEQTISFFRNNKELFINNFEQSEQISDEAVLITTFYLLKHKQEPKAGDKVISVTIQPAPKSILSDALGRNQGNWTLLSISQWIE
jgi:hypothetical protein